MGRITGLYGVYILIAIGAWLGMVVGTLVVAGIAAGALSLVGVKGPAAPILIGVAVIIGTMAVALLAVVVCMRYAIAVPALVLEKLAPGKALGRSSTLAKGRLWQIFLACLLTYLISLIIRR